MPLHDWTRVKDGIFHDFHHEWISAIKRRLNAGILPRGYYALAEQLAATKIPDVLALAHEPQTGANGDDDGQENAPAGGLAIQTATPKVRFTSAAESELYARKASQIVVRHVSGDTVVALIEIVSPGNKSSQHALQSFVEKARAFLEAGIHLLVLDLFPPSVRDPQGIHGAIWSTLDRDDYRQPEDEPLTVVAYQAAAIKRAYIEPTAVGRPLIDMPLYLTEDGYVFVPLETTYEEAFGAVPERWRSVLERQP